MQPEVVLEDLIHAFHPDLLPDYKPTLLRATELMKRPALPLMLLILASIFLLFC